MASYTVRSGDTLWGIAQRHLGSGARWKELGYGGDPRTLRVGTVLNWGAPAPAPAAPAPGPAPKTELQSFAEKMAAEQNALLARQKVEQEGLFGGYETLRGNQEQLPGMYGRLKTELGIPELQGTFQQVQGEIYNVKNLLDHLDEDIQSRALGTFTSDAQRRRISAAEGDVLRTNLGRLGTGLEPIAQALTGAQGELSAQLQLGIQQQERELEPIKLRINAISDRFAREITGFTSNKQTTLDALVDKIERDRQLSDREWELAQQLAAEERDFSRKKELARISASQAAANYLPSRSVSTPARQSSGGLNLSSFMPQQQKLTVQGSSGSGNILQPAGGGNRLQGGSGINLQGGGGFNLQGGGGIRLQ